MPFCGKGFDASPRAPVNDADASVRQSAVSERSPTWSIGTVDFDFGGEAALALRHDARRARRARGRRLARRGVVDGAARRLAGNVIGRAVGGEARGAVGVASKSSSCRPCGAGAMPSERWKCVLVFLWQRSARRHGPPLGSGHVSVAAALLRVSTGAARPAAMFLPRFTFDSFA